MWSAAISKGAAQLQHCVATWGVQCSSGPAGGGADCEPAVCCRVSSLPAKLLSGRMPVHCCLQVDPACLGQLGLGPAVLTRSRANGFLNMLGEAPALPSLHGPHDMTCMGPAGDGGSANPAERRALLVNGHKHGTQRWLHGHASPEPHCAPVMNGRKHEEAGAHAGGRPAALPLTAHYRRGHRRTGRVCRGTGESWEVPGTVMLCNSALHMGV